MLHEARMKRLEENFDAHLSEGMVQEAQVRQQMNIILAIKIFYLEISYCIYIYVNGIWFPTRDLQNMCTSIDTLLGSSFRM